MAKTKIRRKSLSNKKRRSNKKKSVRRQKKVGGEKDIASEFIKYLKDKNNSKKCIKYGIKNSGEIIEPISGLKKKLFFEPPKKSDEAQSKFFNNVNLIAGFEVLTTCVESDDGESCVQSNCNPNTDIKVGSKVKVISKNKNGEVDEVYKEGKVDEVYKDGYYVTFLDNSNRFVSKNDVELLNPGDCKCK